MLRTVKECYESRHALPVLMEVEIKNRTSSTCFGVFWGVLDPLILLGLYTFVIWIVFGRCGPGYPLFVLTGLVIGTMPLSAHIAHRYSFMFSERCSQTFSTHSFELESC